jgi:SAM-dependent methyltransferase
MTTIEFHSRPCPVCGSADDSHVIAEGTVDVSGWSELSFSSRKLPEYVHHRMVECPVCDLVYASPTPVEGVLEKGYEEAPFVSSEESVFAAATYRRLVEPVLNELPNRRAALDVGASDGAFLQVLLDEGFEGVTGVEPAAASAAAAPEAIRSRIRVEPFRSETLAGESFDLVTSFQTLEHVSDPHQVVRDAYKLLEIGGAALFVVHDRRALPARLMRARSPIYDVEHVQLFSTRSVRELLRRAGFEDIRVARVTNRYPLRYWMKLAPIPVAVKRHLLPMADRLRVGAVPVTLRPGNLVATGWKRAETTEKPDTASVGSPQRNE